MNYLHDCRTCGGPVYGSWLHSYHKCKPTPYVIIYQSPQPDPEPVEAAALADNITPGEATRLCALIKIEMAKHFASCKWCQMLKEQDLMCVDGIWLQDALDHWNEYTLIEVDKHAK